MVPFPLVERATIFFTSKGMHTPSVRDSRNYLLSWGDAITFPQKLLLKTQKGGIKAIKLPL